MPHVVYDDHKCFPDKKWAGFNVTQTNNGYTGRREITEQFDNTFAISAVSTP